MLAIGPLEGPMLKIRVHRSPYGKLMRESSLLATGFKKIEDSAEDIVKVHSTGFCPFATRL